MDRSALDYWGALAGKWRIVPPLAPSADDVAFYEKSARGLAGLQDGAPMSALLLGVTPSIVAMQWPAGTSLVSVDWAIGMLLSLWPKRGLPEGSSRVRADWRELPLSSGSRNFAIGDGRYSVFSCLEAAASLNREVHRVLRTGGLYCLRCFCQPEHPLSLDGLFEELFTGRLCNLDLFRWLLAMALQGRSREGVRLRAVWHVWNKRVRDSAAWGQRLGWSEDGLANIERWSTLDSQYFFPTLEQLRELAEPGFDLLSCHRPLYEWGECFPRLLMQAK